jgi:hypothetical protein
VLKEFSLTLDVKLRWNMSVLCITIVYGPTDDVAKTLILEELISLRPQSPDPWLMRGISTSSMRLETRAT